ncbi:MAG: hypothetical protein IGS38_08520 [Synechococcales cyanobacterium M58_A2018_015]|nr:hypothetical protein [Synechococcales cyanobacterium M58_A2018_015]
MTQANLLELAKQGDPQAIAALMNQSLQSKGMMATVERQGDELEVILEAERVPNRQALTAFVQQGIHNLGMQSIRSIRILGQQIGAGSPAWMQELIIDSAATGTPLIIQPETETLEQSDLEIGSLDQEAGTDSGESVTAVPASIEELLMESELPTEPSLSLEEQLMQLELAELPADDESSAELAALWNQQSQVQPDDFLQELLTEPTDLAADEPASEATPATDLSEAALAELLGEPDAGFPSASADSDAELLDFFTELSDGTSTDTAFPSEPTQTESTLAEDWFSETSDDSAVPPQDWFIESSEGVVETSTLDAALIDESVLDESGVSEVSESSESNGESIDTLDESIADLLSSGFSSDFSESSADDATPEFAFTDVATEEVASEPAHPTGQPDAEWIGFLGEADSADSNESLEPPDFLFDLESETAGSSEPFRTESPEFSSEALQEWFSDASDTPDTAEGALEAEQALAELASDSAAADDEGLLDFLDTLSDPMVSPEATSQDLLPETEAAFSADTRFEADLDLQTGLGELPADSPVDYPEESVLAWDGSELADSDSFASLESQDVASSEVEPLEPATPSEWLTAPFVTPEPPEELLPAPQSPVLQEESFGVDSATTDWEPADFQVASSEERTDAAAPETESTLGAFSSRAAETEAEAQLYDQIDSLFAAEPETSEFAGFSEETVFEQPVSDMPPELAQNWLGETAASLDLSQPHFLDSTTPESTLDPNATVWMNPQELTEASEFSFAAEEPQPPAELLQEFSWDDEESVAATPSAFTESTFSESAFESAFTESPELTGESADFSAAEWPEDLPEELAAALIEPPLPEEPVAYSDEVSEISEVDEIIAPPDFLLEMSGELPATAPATEPSSSAAFDAFQFNEAASNTSLEEDDFSTNSSEPDEAAFFVEPAGERIAEIAAEDFNEDFNWDMLADPLSPQDTSLGFSEADFSFDEFSFAEPELPLSVNTADVTATDPLDYLSTTDELPDEPSEAATATADAMEETSDQGLDEVTANPALSDLFAQQEPGWNAVSDSPESTPQLEDFLTDTAPEATASGDEPLFSANLPASAEATDRTEDVAAPLDPDATVDRNISQDSLEAGLGDFREGFVEQPLPSELLVDDSTGALDWEQELQDAFAESDSTAELTYELEEPPTAAVYPPDESIDQPEDQPDQPSPYPLVPIAAEPAPISPETATMPTNMAQTLPADDSRSPSWLFGLVLLLLAGWLAGLLGFSLLWSRVAPPAAPDAPEPPATPTDSP